MLACSNVFEGLFLCDFGSSPIARKENFDSLPPARNLRFPVFTIDLRGPILNVSIEPFQIQLCMKITGAFAPTVSEKSLRGPGDINAGSDCYCR